MKITIPRKVIAQPPREFYISDGDLVLLVTSKRGQTEGTPNSAVLGVLESVDEKKITLKPAYVLRPCQRLGGRDIPLIERLSIPMAGEPKTGEFGGTYRLNANIKGLYAPQEKVVKQLKLWLGFEPHANWVKELEKPYLK